MALVAASASSAVDRERPDTGILGNARNIESISMLPVPACAHFQCDWHVHGANDGGQDSPDEIGTAIAEWRQGIV